MAIFIPAACNLSCTSTAASISAINKLSVISTSIFSAATSNSIRQPNIVGTKFLCLNWRGEIFTAILIGLPKFISNTFACFIAVRMTHSPIGTIRPVSSAIGINSFGGQYIPGLVCQRISASTPTIVIEFKLICGW